MYKIFLLLLIMVGIVPQPIESNPYPTQWLVQVAVAPLYESPDCTTPYQTQALYGTLLTATQYLNHGWFNVTAADGTQGYCVQSDLTPYNPEWLEISKTHRVKDLIGCVYPEPRVQSQTILRLSYNSPVYVVESITHGDWIQVQLIDGQRGWMVRSTIEKTTPLTLTESLERAAMFLGIPYIWGGTSSFGIDCSALCQIIAKQRGYTPMKRKAAQQYNDPHLIKVPLEDIQPGDFVYFEREGKIIHVALCTQPGIMIHAYGANGISKVVQMPLCALASIIKEARRLPVEG